MMRNPEIFNGKMRFLRTCSPLKIAYSFLIKILRHLTEVPINPQ